MLNLKNFKVIQNLKRQQFHNLIIKFKNPQELAFQYQNDLQTFYKKIKKITTLNPNQREGGIFSYFKDENGNIHFGQEAISNCLNVLDNSPNLYEYQPQLPLTEDVQDIQQNMSSNKAIGYDGISDFFLKSTKNYSLLQDLWQNSTLESNRLCCQARLIPLHKAFPKIPSNTQFRPITVLSSLFKFLELCFLPQLQNYMELKLSNQQTGLAPNSSTQINITNILNKINSFQKKDKMNCILIDFLMPSTVSIVLYFFQFYLIRKFCFYKILSFLEIYILMFTTKILLLIKLITLIMECLRALLFPLTYLIFIQKIFQISFQFADDIATIIQHKDSLEYLKILERYSIQYNLNINKRKSGIFLLHNHTKISDIMNYQVVQEYKYLGLLVGNNGKLKQHFHKLKILVNYINLKLKQISHQFSWKQKYHLWQTYITPHILYSLSAIPSQKHKNIFKELEKIYKSSFKIFVGFPKRLPDKVTYFLIPNPQPLILRASQQKIYKMQLRQITYKPPRNTIEIQNKGFDQIKIDFLPKNFTGQFR